MKKRVLALFALALVLLAVVGVGVCFKRNQPQKAPIDSLSTTEAEMSGLSAQTGKTPEAAAFFEAADEFIERFNEVYESRNGVEYLKPLDEWAQGSGEAPICKANAKSYRFSSDTKRWSVPTLTVYQLQSGDGICEYKLTFDEHSYQEALYEEYKEMCICAFSATLPTLTQIEATALCDEVYESACENFAGEKEHPAEAAYQGESVSIYGYYGAGTVNICIVPIN